jgi:hypothetical protein
VINELCAEWRSAEVTVRSVIITKNYIIIIFLIIIIGVDSPSEAARCPQHTEDNPMSAL